MKSMIIAAIAVIGAGVTPAFAQTATEPSLTQPQGYLNLGYTYLNPYDRDLGQLTGRAGLRFGRYWGIEGEVGGGVIGNNYTNAAGNRVNLTEGVSPAAYLVGYLPVLPKLDLLARVGYGETPLSIRSDSVPTSVAFTNTINVMSWNYGAGVQYMVDPKDGIRFDYTRRDFQAPGFDNPQDINTFAVSYVRKF